MRDEEPEPEVILVTADYGIHVIGKARRRNIQLLVMPDEYKLPEEPDPAQKEIMDLRRQLAEERARRPKLSLVFDSGEPLAQFRIYPPISLPSEQILKQIEAVKKRHPKKELPPSTQGKTVREVRQEMQALGSPFNLASLLGPTREDVEKYNGELDKFYLRYEQYLELLNRHENSKHRTITLNIQITNTGTAPAEDLDLFLHFPDGFHVFVAERPPKLPEPPQPPAVPESHLSAMLKPTPVPYLPSTLSSRLDLPDGGPEPNVSAPYIQRTNSYDVEIQVGRVKHGIPESLRPLCIMFESYETASSFEIAYHILSANVPDPDTGTLHVIIEKAPAET